jgi:hypothetical protein
MTAIRPVPFRPLLGRVLLLALAGATLMPAAAQAWWRGGVFFGFPPVYVGPPPVYYYPPAPVYVGPPVTYAAPPAYSAPSNSGPPLAGQACYAGQWVCPLDRPTPSGNACSCPANGGLSWGRAN